MLAPREKRVFVKDMAYQVNMVLSPDLASRFVNTFIVRDPKYVLVSEQYVVYEVHATIKKKKKKPLFG